MSAPSDPIVVEILAARIGGIGPEPFDQLAPVSPAEPFLVAQDGSRVSLVDVARGYLRTGARDAMLDEHPRLHRLEIQIEGGGGGLATDPAFFEPILAIHELYLLARLSRTDGAPLPAEPTEVQQTVPLARVDDDTGLDDVGEAGLALVGAPSPAS